MNEGTSITPKTVAKSTVAYPTPLGGSIDKLKAQKLISNPGYKKGLALHGFLKKPRYALLTVVRSKILPPQPPEDYSPEKACRAQSIFRRRCPHFT